MSGITYRRFGRLGLPDDIATAALFLTSGPSLKAQKPLLGCHRSGPCPVLNR